MLFPVIDGFDHYAAANGAQGALDTDWSVITNIPTFIPGLGGDGQAIRWGINAAIGRMEKTFAGDSKITCHFAIRIVSRAAGGLEFLHFLTAAGSHQFGLGMNAGGQFQLYGEGDAVLATSSTALLLNQVYRCCLRADLVAGTFRMSINGDDDAGLHVTVDLQDDPTSNLVEMISIRMAATGFGTSITYDLDDFILGTGETVDWGPQEVNTLPADSDMAVAWTRSGGANNFGNVDDLPFTIDADYNFSSTVGQKDCFGYRDLPHVPDSILAVQLMTVARKEESAVRRFREFLRIAGTDYPGIEHNLAESYGRWTSTWLLNPATGVAWTAAELNALQGGYELTVAA
jgi:hypothetical protein